MQENGCWQQLELIWCETEKKYIYINCTVNMGIEKSVSPTSFGRGRFQGNLFSFEKHN